MSDSSSTLASDSLPRAVVSCRRDLQIAPRPCADPAVCGAFCANARAAQWKSFRGDRASQPAAQHRRLERGQMIQHVLHVLRAQFRVCLVSVSDAAESHQRVSLKETMSVRLLVHVAKHIELLMYRAAFSKTEYGTLATVARRVQHFAMVMNCNPRWKVKVLPRHQPEQSDSSSRAASATRKSSSGNSLALEERRRKVWLFTPAWWGTRDGRSDRQQQQGVLINGNDKSYWSLVALSRSLHHSTSSHSVRPTPASQQQTQLAATTSAPAHSPLRALFDGRETPALINIFSFLSGSAVVRSFAINRLCYRELPRAVTDLRISSTGLVSLLSQLEARSRQISSKAVLLPNLQLICVRPDARPALSTSASSSQVLTTPSSSVSALPDKRRRSKSPPMPLQPEPVGSTSACVVPHSVVASACPPQHMPARISGELAVLALAKLIQTRHVPNLRKLCLCATFVNTVARNGVFALSEALAAPNTCPQFEYLWLGGNALGDYGAMCVAKVLASGACPKLAFLDLRSNFIGHDGMLSLASALVELGERCSLEQLCLGSNLLTPECVGELARCLDSGALRKLAFLGLDGNFLSPACFAPVAHALVRGACPKLLELCVGGNAELSEQAIAAVFKDAADADDGASWGLFRPCTRALPSAAASGPMEDGPAAPNKRRRVN